MWDIKGPWVPIRLEKFADRESLELESLTTFMSRAWIGGPKPDFKTVRIISSPTTRWQRLRWRIAGI